jgi:large subunit ribosomal protein L18
MKKKISNLKKRHLRIRKKVKGTFDKPRFSIFRSNLSFNIQLIDDEKGHTLLSLNSKDVKEIEGSKKNKLAINIFIKKLTDLMLEKKIKRINFDRSGYKYTEKIKIIADYLINNGISFK